MRIEATQEFKKIQIFCSEIFYPNAIWLKQKINKCSLVTVELPSGCGGNKNNPYDYKADKHNYMKYYRKNSERLIKNADICVFLNLNHQINGRIGGSTFTELVMASMLNKRIILVQNPNPEQIFYDDIIGMDYEVISISKLEKMFC